MMLCETVLSLAGTFAPGAAPPAGFPGGCWPDGRWTFSTTIVSNTCASSPPLRASYVFQVVQDEDFNNTITYESEPAATVGSKVSGGEGGGLCTGAFLIYGADGKTVLNLRPSLRGDNTINGQGDYRLYDQDQR